MGISEVRGWLGEFHVFGLIFDLRISKAACGVVRNFYFRRCGWGQVGISKVECRVVRNFAISKVQGRRKGNFVFSACPVLG